MKIGITCYPTYGGSGVIATELGEGLAARGHDVHFISYEIPSRLNQFSERVFFHEVKVYTYPLFEHSPYTLALAAKMSEIAEYHKLDILHVHYAIPHSISAYLAQKIMKNHKIKTITTLHGTDITLVGNDPAFLPITKFGVEVSNGVTAVSEYLRQRTNEEFHIIKDICVIPNFVDTDKFFPVDSEELKNHIAPKGEFIISHISNFRPVKRVEAVVEIFKIVNENLPAKLLLIGDGPERARIERFCHKLKICDSILFLGKQDSIPELLSISDIFLLPSETESFGLAALEAMSCEVPVVASNVGGLPEVIEDGECGYLIDKDNIPVMANKVLTILQNPDYRECMGKKGRKCALDKFDKHLILPRYEEYYQEILS